MIVQKFSGRAAALVALCALISAPARLQAAGPNDAAVKEGTVVWYATMNTKDMDLTADEFMRTHPGIHVETLRLGSSQLPARVATEQRAGQYNADVISGDGFQVFQLIAGGAFGKHTYRDADKFIAGTVDSGGEWANLYLNTTVLAWNPDRLKADHLKPPQSVADFANPEWKGKFGFDTGALNWYVGLLQNRKDGAALAQKIADNSPVKTLGHTQTVSSLETGEFDATPTAYGYLSEQEKEAGKSIDYANPTPLFASLNPIGVAKNAPHPNAASVFIDWMLSRDGQQYLAQRGGGEISSCTDVKSNPKIWNLKRPYVIIAAPKSSEYNDREKEFRTMFGLLG